MFGYGMEGIGSWDASDLTSLGGVTYISRLFMDLGTVGDWSKTGYGMDTLLRGARAN